MNSWQDVICPCVHVPDVAFAMTGKALPFENDVEM